MYLFVGVHSCPGGVVLPLLGRFWPEVLSLALTASIGQRAPAAREGPHERRLDLDAYHLPSGLTYFHPPLFNTPAGVRSGEALLSPVVTWSDSPIQLGL